MLKALDKSLGIVSTACKNVGINRSTHYEWLKIDPKYKQSVDDINEAAIEFVESELFENIKEGNVIAQIFYLKTKGKSKGYVEKTETEISTKSEGIKLIIHEKNEK